MKAVTNCIIKVIYLYVNATFDIREKGEANLTDFICKNSQQNKKTILRLANYFKILLAKLKF